MSSVRPDCAQGVKRCFHRIPITVCRTHLQATAFCSRLAGRFKSIAAAGLLSAMRAGSCINDHDGIGGRLQQHTEPRLCIAQALVFLFDGLLSG